MSSKIAKILNPIRKARTCLHKCWIWYKGQYIGRPWWYKAITAVWSFFAFIFVYCFSHTFDESHDPWRDISVNQSAVTDFLFSHELLPP